MTQNWLQTAGRNTLITCRNANLMMRPALVLATGLLSIPILLLSINLSSAAQPMQASQGSPSAKKIVGYYISWAIYGRNYSVTSIPAGKLTHINYAFANNVNGK